MDTSLFWVCPDCVDTYHRNKTAIKEQGELNRIHAEELASITRPSPYRFVPYVALTLGFVAFLLAWFT